MIKITDVKIRKMTSNDPKFKALASVTFDDSFVVHDIKIINNNNSLFIAMPSRKESNGEFRDIAHPINMRTRCELERRILAEYERFLESDND